MPPQPRAKKGQAMNSHKVSAMLGMLKYQSSFGKGERQDASCVALKIYQELGTAEDKANYLEEFEKMEVEKQQRP